MFLWCALKDLIPTTVLNGNPKVIADHVLVGSDVDVGDGRNI